MFKVIGLLILFLSSTLVAQQKFTIEEQFHLEYPISISASPDGKFVAFTIRKADWSVPKWNTQLYLLNTRTQEIKQFTHSKNSVSSVKFSPDGKFIYFLTDREFQNELGKTIKGVRQLWRIPVDGGEAEVFLTLTNGIEEFTFSKNGRFLALLTEKELDDSIRKALEEKVITKNDEIVYPKSNPEKEIWIYDFNSKTKKKLFTGDAGISNVTFSSKGNFILYQTNYTGEYNDEQKHDLFLLTLDGQVKQITDFDGPETNPETSPDEIYISFVSQTVPDIEFAETDIELLDLKTNTRINLTENFNLSVLSYTWHPIQNKIFLLVNQGVYTPVYQIDIDKKQIFRITEPNSVISNLKITQDGDLFFIYEDHKSLREIARLNKGRIEILSNYSKQLEMYTISPPELIQYISKDKKFIIDALLVKPTFFNEKHKYPLILCIHGGPYSVFKRTLLQSYPMQVYANEGYVVVAPNIRGSSGYSDEFGQANRYDLGGKDFEDAIAAVDFVIEEGFVDTTRMGVIGGSYGGYLTNWIISQTNRFSAAVSMYGIFSWFTDFSNTFQPIFEKMYFGYYYWEKPIDMNHLWVNRSPAFYVQNIQTPVLILQGEKDRYTNIANSQEMYQALITLGRTVEYVVYPREDHGIRNEPQHYLNMLKRGLNWFNKYLKN